MKGSRFTIGIALIVVILAVALFFLFRLILSEPTTNTPNVSVEGKVVCLPHKDKTGPVTFECALGVLADDGRHYALRSASNDLQIATIPGGSRVQVTGTLLEPSATEKYDIAGLIDVTDIVQR